LLDSTLVNRHLERHPAKCRIDVLDDRDDAFDDLRYSGPFDGRNVKFISNAAPRSVPLKVFDRRNHDGNDLENEALL